MRSDFRRLFVRGLAVLLPSILTLWLLVYTYQFVQGFIAEPINRSLRITIANVARIGGPVQAAFDPLPSEVEEEFARLRAPGRPEPKRESIRAVLRQRNVNLWWREHWWMDLIGFGVAIVGVYVAGRLVGGYLGRRLYSRFEHVVVAVPVIRSVYPSVKQVVDFLISDERPMQFSRVVTVEYPRRGIWSLGLLTGPGMPQMTALIADADGSSTTPRSSASTSAARGEQAQSSSGEHEEHEFVTVFIPSSPTPFTGYTITVPRSDVRELPISIDAALRFVVSGGVLHPDQALPEAQVPRADHPSGIAAAASRGTERPVMVPNTLAAAEAPDADDRPKMKHPPDQPDVADHPRLRNGPERGS